MSRQAATVAFKGGLNTEAPFLEMPPGECLQLFNYEVTPLGRYRRLQGYERFDGQALASNEEPVGAYSTPEAYWAAKEALEDAQRALILKPPGEGPVRGVVQYKGDTYAFRDNVGATASIMYKATAGGWAVVAGVPALQPGGRYEFRIDNFLATTGTIGGGSSELLVGVDGKNKAFTFDGTTFTQLTTGMTVDTPTHLEVSAVKKLFLGFPNGSLVFSKTGDPTDFTAAAGAGEIGTSDYLVGIEVQPNNSLAVLGRGSSHILYGDVIGNFELTTLSRTVGAVEWSIQTLGSAYYLDDRGATTLARVQNYGNFEANTFAKKVSRLVRGLRGRVTASIVVREKNQYRVFLDDQSGIIFTFNSDGLVGVSTFTYAFQTFCTFSGEDADGNEILLAGGDDGYVYRLDSGTSFDGEAFTSVCRPAYNNLRGSTAKQRYHKLTLEVATQSKANLQVVPEYDYMSDSTPVHPTVDVAVLGGGAFWDQGTWDESTWFTAAVHLAQFYVRGIAKNMSPVIFSTAKMEPPHTLNSMVVEYSPLARVR